MYAFTAEDLTTEVNTSFAKFAFWFIKGDACLLKTLKNEHETRVVFCFRCCKEQYVINQTTNTLQAS